MLFDANSFCPPRSQRLLHEDILKEADRETRRPPMQERLAAAHGDLMLTSLGTANVNAMRQLAERYGRGFHHAAPRRTLRGG
jgi:hypothetical protein